MASLSERYRVHNKPKSNKSLLVYIFVFVILVFSTSFSRYITKHSATLGMNVAKWNIKINNTIISQATTSLNNDINLVVTENATADGIIKPGQKGYFDIVLDPQNTEVSLKYEIFLDTSNLPSQIQLVNYTLNNSNIKTSIPNNKKIEGTILLNGEESLNLEDKKTYRIYWQWPIENGKIDEIKSNYKIKANVKIEQCLNT